MRRVRVLAALVLALALVCGCASTTKMTACHHDGGVRQIRVQSVNAPFLVCVDGRVYRYDTNGG